MSLLSDKEFRLVNCVLQKKVVEAIMLFSINIQIENPKTLFISCLEYVATNIDRFAAAYNRCTVLQRQDFYTLQIIASKDLIQLVHDFANHRNEYLPLLLSHLKELDINLLGDIAPERILDKLSATGHGLQCVHLEGQTECPEDQLRDSVWSIPPPWSEHQIMQLAFLIPSVEKLTLCDTKCTNRVLEIISDNCPLLRVLHLTKCKGVTDEGIACLCKRDINGCYIKNDKLEELDISHTSSTEKAVHFCLSNFPNLKKLRREDLVEIIYSKHKGDISICLPKYNLTALEISRKGDADVITILSLICPKLTDFGLKHLTSQTKLDAFKGFTQLTSATLLMVKDQKLDVFPFLAARGSILQRLLLAGCTVSIEWIAKYCPQLETLALETIEFLPFKPLMAHFTKLDALQLVSIEGDITAAYLSLCSILAASENLQKLSLESFPASFDGLIDAIVAAEWCYKLRRLQFYDSGSISTDSIIKFISWASHLKVLSIGGDDVPESMYSALPSLLREVKNKSTSVFKYSNFKFQII